MNLCIPLSIICFYEQLDSPPFACQASFVFNQVTDGKKLCGSLLKYLWYYFPTQLFFHQNILHASQCKKSLLVTNIKMCTDADTFRAITQNSVLNPPCFHNACNYLNGTKCKIMQSYRATLCKNRICMQTNYYYYIVMNNILLRYCHFLFKYVSNYRQGLKTN